MNDVDPVGWMIKVADHAEKHGLHLVLVANVLERWSREYRQWRAAGSAGEGLPIGRYRRIWSAVPQMTPGWETLKRRYPADFVEFIEECVIPQPRTLM